MTRSEAIRKSILDAATALRRREALQTEVASLEADRRGSRVRMPRSGLAHGEPSCRGVMSTSCVHLAELATSNRADGSESSCSRIFYLPRSIVILVAPTSRSVRTASFRPAVVIEKVRPPKVLVELESALSTSTALVTVSGPREPGGDVGDRRRA